MIKKKLLDSELWSDVGYIGTVMTVQLPISLKIILKTKRKNHEASENIWFLIIPLHPEQWNEYLIFLAAV